MVALLTVGWVLGFRWALVASRSLRRDGIPGLYGVSSAE
jgi:hypothetical protein